MDINRLKSLLFTLLFVGIFSMLIAQEKKEVEIINADYLKYQETDGKKLTKLIGDVQLRQEDVYMWCDSALLNKETNSVDAYGHVQIQQDTITAYSNTLHYEGNKKFAVLRGNAILTDSKMKLFTEELFYNISSKTAYYLTTGKVYRDSSIIVSKKGYYYSSSKEVFFKDSVRITDPNYQLNSDTLRYHTETKVSTFYGNTEIFNKNSRIVCNNGWYDSQRDVSAFGKNTVIVNPPQLIYADSLYYDRAKGFGKAYDKFRWVDSTMDVELFGRYGEYEDERQYIMATKQPLMIYKMANDSLFLTADTLKSQTKSATDTIRNFFAYHKVRLFMNDMQGVCDSLFYSFEDSTFRMFYNPVLWSDDTQLSGDTIYLRTKEKKAESMTIYNAGFIVTPAGKKYFDQIKGINIFGYFTNNELSKVEVRGNAESIYYGKDDKNKYIGNNKAQSTDIDLYFSEKKISRIVFIRKPEAVFTPIKLLTDEQMKLKDFKWIPDRKPKNREEFIELLR